jgi:hypothetical protein
MGRTVGEERAGRVGIEAGSAGWWRWAACQTLQNTLLCCTAPLCTGCQGEGAFLMLGRIPAAGRAGFQASQAAPQAGNARALDVRVAAVQQLQEPGHPRSARKT